MTAAEATRLAQSDPVPNMTAAWGEQVAKTRLAVEILTMHLRALDTQQEQLGKREITVSTDLGPIGNAAAAARRDLEKQKNDTPFVMPRA